MGGQIIRTFKGELVENEAIILFVPGLRHRKSNLSSAIKSNINKALFLVEQVFRSADLVFLGGSMGIRVESGHVSESRLLRLAPVQDSPAALC